VSRKKASAPLCSRLLSVMYFMVIFFGPYLRCLYKNKLH